MNVLLYAIIVILTQAFFWCLYKVLLSSTSSHSFSRFFLLASLVGSFFMPLLEFEYFPTQEADHLAIDARHTVLTQVENITDSFQVAEIPKSYSFEIILALTLFISISLLVRFLSRVIGIGSKASGEYMKVGSLKIFQSEDRSAYSFFNHLFIPDQVLKESLQHPVILHEAAHAKYFHSFDRLLVDFLTALFWFNPIIRIYKKSLIGIHEFQADADVLKKGVNHVSYQNLILNAVVSQQAVVSYFRKDLLKRRILMINNAKKYSIKRLISVLSLSALFIGLMSFRTENMSVMEDLGPWETLHIGTLDLINLWERPSIFPVDKSKKHRISSPFGLRSNPWNHGKDQFHYGMDISMAEGSEVYATADGVIVEARYFKNGYGNKVSIAHEGEEELVTSYAHLKSYIVVKGENVKKGDLIGYVGSTGKSRGPHLHYSVCRKGKYVNPMDFVKNY